MTAPELRPPTTLDRALRLHGMGFSIIPLKPRDKRPALSSWKQYQTERATEEQLRVWFDEGEHNIGIVTGAISNVVVVDADSADAQAWVAQQHPSPMRTKTGKGQHFWFLHPGRPIRNNAKLRGMDLDVRGDGGYVVAPGSIHPSGLTYEEDGHWGDVWDLPVFDPSWLGEKVQPLGKPAEDLDRRVQRYLAAAGPAIEGQGGDAHTYRIACKLVRGFSIPEDQALRYLQDWNMGCTPAWSERELAEKIRSAIANGTEPFGARAAAGRTDTGGASYDASIDDGGAGVWQDRLSRTDKGGIRKTPGNLAKILREDARWGLKLSLDEMSRAIIYEGRIVEDPFVDFVQEQIEDHHGVAFGREEVAAKLLAQAAQNTIHPVREWLRQLPAWDQVERLPKVAAEILHSSDPLTTHYMRCTMVGAVRRVFNPGTKFDTLPVLAGPQGIGKSSFWRVLVGQEWFGDSPIDLENKDGFLVLHRKWCTELSEIDHATGNKAAERIKAFLSSSEDIFRPPFGRSVSAFQRSCFIVGTTNREGFLVDPTGSRRFWPIQCGDSLNLGLLAEWRLQLWAEAMDLYSSGVSHWLDRTQEGLRHDQSSQFETEDPWEGQIESALESFTKLGRLLSMGIPLSDLMNQMGLPVSQQTRGAAMKVASILKNMGWKRTLLGNKRVNAWFPPQE